MNNEPQCKPIGRPPRPMYARQTTVYLSEEQEVAIDKSRVLLREKRGVKAPALNDIVGYAVVDLKNRLEKE